MRMYFALSLVMISNIINCSAHCNTTKNDPVAYDLSGVNKDSLAFLKKCNLDPRDILPFSLDLPFNIRNPANLSHGQMEPLDHTRDQAKEKTVQLLTSLRSEEKSLEDLFKLFIIHREICKQLPEAVHDGNKHCLQTYNWWSKKIEPSNCSDDDSLYHWLQNFQKKLKKGDSPFNEDTLRRDMNTAYSNYMDYLINRWAREKK